MKHFAVLKRQQTKPAILTTTNQMAAVRTAAKSNVTMPQSKPSVWEGSAACIVDAIEARFQFVCAGEFDRDSSGWPVRWRYQADVENRTESLKQVRWFASNCAPLFGRLLTPLVEGLRVKGPFKPDEWSDETGVPPIVLLDGIGLGHSRGTGVQISTSVTRRFDLAHAIVLVDDATKPVLDAAQALLRTVTASGHERKFAIVFTNFDRMKGDDFGSGSAGTRDKKRRV